MKAKLRKRNASKSLLSFFLILVCLGITAQDIPVFGWKSHFSYHQIPFVASSNDRYVAASTLAAYFIDQQDQSINLLNKNTGLSDIAITALRSSASGSLFAIGYENGNIDILNGSEIRNVDDILNAENIPQKRINDFLFENEFLWVSSDFGIAKYDLSEGVIVESYQNIGPNGSRLAIRNLVLKNDSIYAASDDGILSVSLDDQTNRQDFNFWRRQLSGLPFHAIAQNTTGILASSDTDLFLYNNGEWVFDSNLSSRIEETIATPDAFYILIESGLFRFHNGTLTQLLAVDTNQKFLSLSLQQEHILIGTENHGLLFFENANNEPTQILPQGPAGDQHILAADSANQFFWLSNEAISQYHPKEQLWSSKELLVEGTLAPITDPNDFSKSINSIISSFEEGLFVEKPQGFEPISSFSPNNSLTSINGRYNIAAIQTDERADLWSVQTGLEPQLHQWDQRNNTWQAYRLTHPQSNHLTNLFIMDNGDKWMTVDDARGGGVLVYNEESDRERYLTINGGQGGLPGSLVNDVVQDQERFIWIGTDEGICFYSLPEQILTNAALTASIPIFQGSFLLRDEHITKIAIDPANRKWIGTLDNGVWLFSETGEELIQYFTSENSPLPSNHILDISIDEGSGEVYFTTTKGIASFRSDATLGAPEHGDVKIYPNPVGPNFNGLVIIEGLANNVELRLTDTSGKLTRVIQANGSTAIWNVKDLQGNRVSAGVYLIFSSNADGSETFVGKIVVI